MPKKTAKQGKKLVIVESPAKAKTINKYLGSDYVVKASMGHVRDLPSKGMGVDLETFVPEYEVLESRGKVIKELRALAKSSDEVFLATDLDREGEAIAWHLKETLAVPDSKAHRVIFNAITKAEIQKAFKNPMSIDINRVNAQQARRILDRIVGYEISPLLWRKVARGLSAGRVQSVAVRLIVEREREIEAFIPEEFWKIGGIFSADAAKAPKLAAEWHDYLSNTGNGERTKAERDKWLADHGAFIAELIEVAGEKFTASDRNAARRVAELLGFKLEKEDVTADPEGKGPAAELVRFHGQLSAALPRFTIRSIEKKRTTSKPPAPFITSTIQQGASSRLGFGAQRTMRLAQSLYEAGHITYMRTDSTSLSADAITMARSFIESAFGPRYLPENPNTYASSNKSAQEAHEAIRPTDASFTPKEAHAKLGPDEYKVYQLIWSRFIACQMPPAEFDQTTVNIAAATRQGDAIFRASGRKLVFDGFMKVAGVTSEDQLLPSLAENQQVYPIQIDPTQHFTQPPPRFSEASLVKELERLGIGRPSTYASIIQTIQDREYVMQQDRRFYATMLGSIVTDKLIQGFPEIMNVQFTAGMELKLDEIEDKHLDWVKLLQDFYGPFHSNVEGALDKLDHAGGTPSPYDCPKCGRPMCYRISKNGFFLSCTGYPACDGTLPVDPQGKPMMREVSEHKCPECGKEMIKRRGRFGQFLGCSGYPDCKTIINLDKAGNPLPPKAKPIPTAIKCEKCGGQMVLRDGKRGPWLGCATFPKCRGIKTMAKLAGEELKHVESLIPALKQSAADAQALVAKVMGTANLPSNGVPANIPTDIDCDECGKPMIIRTGRRGRFLGCSGYPKCKNTGEVPAKLLEELGISDNGKNGNGATPSSPPTDEE
ncbi:MAG TPA: type I DNA topoisomerase [Tepidisphaeraceae bacterium]|nr:type I DNA topoisomerase [Tepidisphaeraceae bacterium]